MEADPVSPKVFEIVAHFYDDDMEDENESSKPQTKARRKVVTSTKKMWSTAEEDKIHVIFKKCFLEKKRPTPISPILHV